MPADTSQTTMPAEGRWHQ